MAKDSRNKSRSDKPTGDKPTREEMDRRIEFVAKLVMLRKTTGAIKRMCNKRYGVSARTAENYLARARDSLKERAERPTVEYMAEAIRFYESIVGDVNQKAIDRIKAQNSIDKIRGLHSPDKLELTGRDGGPIQTEDLTDLTDEELDVLIKAADRLDELSMPSGKGTSSNGKANGTRH